MTRQSAIEAAVMLAGPVILIGLVVGLFYYTQSSLQSALDERQGRALHAVFPDADRFSERTGDPPHFKAFGRATGNGDEDPIGVVFLTTEVEPSERGYAGPIHLLVGMTVGGSLTGITLISHQEPFGDFSIETEGFRAQFVGKSILDPFRVGRDVDAIARATITVSSAVRGIRNAARRIARQYVVDRANPP